MKPRFENFNGAKTASGVPQQIINKMPPHEIYIELFLGTGEILYKKKPATYNLGIDKDFGVIQKHKENKAFDFQCLDSLDFLNYSRSWLSFIEKTGYRVLIYADPPYPFFTRRGQRKLYKHEFTDNQHKKLLLYLQSLQCNVILSSYKNKLYDDYLIGWNFTEFEAKTRVGNSTECIYYNFPDPEKLHDYQFIGNDFRERHQLKLLNSRTLKKFERLPELTRNFLLYNLFKKYQS